MTLPCNTKREQLGLPASVACISIAATSVFGRSQGNIVTRVLCGDWRYLGFCLRLVGDSRLERHMYRPAAANLWQILSSLFSVSLSEMHYATYMEVL